MATQTTARLLKVVEDLEKDLDPTKENSTAWRAEQKGADGEPTYSATQAQARLAKLQDDHRAAVVNLHTAERQDAEDDKKQAEKDTRKLSAQQYRQSRGTTPAQNAEQYARDLDAAEALGEITPDEATRRWSAWQYQNQTLPQQQRLEKRQGEVDKLSADNITADNARADRAEGRADQNLALSRDAATRAANAADRAATNDERRFTIEQRKYAQEVGKTAVERAITQDAYVRRRATADAWASGKDAMGGLAAAGAAAPTLNLDDIAEKAIQRALADIIPQTTPAKPPAAASPIPTNPSPTPTGAAPAARLGAGQVAGALAPAPAGTLLPTNQAQVDDAMGRYGSQY